MPLHRFWRQHLLSNRDDSWQHRRNQLLGRVFRQGALALELQSRVVHCEELVQRPQNKTHMLKQKLNKTHIKHILKQYKNKTIQKQPEEGIDLGGFLELGQKHPLQTCLHCSKLVANLLNKIYIGKCLNYL